MDYEPETASAAKSNEIPQRTHFPNPFRNRNNIHHMVTTQNDTYVYSL